MSLVEDVRKLLQDVVTPDLKALDARVTALEKHIEQRFNALDKKIDGVDKTVDSKITGLEETIDLKLNKLDLKIDYKHDLVMQEIRSLSAATLAGFGRMEANLNLERRIERIENERAQAPRLERTA